MIKKYKLCPSCGKTKSSRCFGRRSPGGYLKSPCKVCCRKKQREYTRENRSKVEEYLEKNKEVVAERKREWRKKNPDYNRRYQQANREHINKVKAAYDKRRKATDPSYKIGKLLRTRLYHALKGQARNGSAVRDMGCTVEELKRYLESKWEPGMSWDNWNHDGWHIDHIRPLASFNLADRQELLKACHFTNLQPLWKKDNFRKRAE